MSLHASAVDVNELVEVAFIASPGLGSTGILPTLQARLFCLCTSRCICGAPIVFLLINLAHFCSLSAHKRMSKQVTLTKGVLEKQI